MAALREVGEDRIVSKPYQDDELARKVAAVLHKEEIAAGARVIPFSKRS